MALFTYFPNQAAILWSLTEREFANMRLQKEIFEQHAASEDVEQVLEETLGFYIHFAQEKPNQYCVVWVLPELGVESKKQNRQQMQATVGSLTRMIKIGIAHGCFAARAPLLAVTTVLGMDNMSHILFHSGKMMGPDLRDRMTDEMIIAAMSYLKSGASFNNQRSEQSSG